jgi:hypothetical protein
MSVFQTLNLDCPACGTAVPFEAVQSVNADRRPDLREAILGESFQRQACPSCGESFRVAPDMNYLDLGRNQWFASHPVADMDRWQEIEANDREAFARAFGDAAPPAARGLAANLKPRITFGWAALREKILAAQYNIDDVSLELMKIVMIRGMDDSPVRDDTELRLIDMKDGNLIMAWIELYTEQVAEVLEVPLDFYLEIHADDEGLADLRAQLTAGLFVDMNRLLVPGGPEPEPAAVSAEAVPSLPALDEAEGGATT